MESLAVSVVIPTHNRAGLVARAVESALLNLRPGDELIIVDDGSDDDTPACLATYSDSIRLARIPHRGAGAARNHGIALATRPLVAFLDSDDIWVKDKVELQRALMERRPEVLFCFSDFTARDPGRDTPHFLVHWHKDNRSWDQILGPGERYSGIAPLPPGREDFDVHVGDLYLAEMQRDFVPTFTMMARRDAGAALHFAEDVPTFEDWECFARLARSGKAAFLACDTAWQCSDADSRLTDADTISRASSRLRILDRVWGADPSFMARHRTEFSEVRQRYLRQRGMARLARGEAREARSDFRQCRGVPIDHRVAAALPDLLLRGALGLRRKLVRRGEPV